MKRCWLLLYIFLSNQAEAVRVALEPQNRVLLGAGNVDNGHGVSLSVESRLTQMVYINLGGTVSVPKHYGSLSFDNPENWVRMNHVIWATPGWRGPHRYREKINWDLLVRGGFGCVFSTDAFKEYLFLINPAGIAGLDAYIHYRIDEDTTVGARLNNRLFVYRPTMSANFERITVQKWQNGIGNKKACTPKEIQAGLV